MSRVLLLIALHLVTLQDRYETALAAVLQERNTAAGEAQQPADTTLQAPAAVPSVTFSQPVKSGQSGLVKTVATVNERWLVSEPWCTYCPAAKKRFLASGGKPDHVISIAEARAKHGTCVGSVPHEYTVPVQVEYLQPPTYRKQWPASVTLDGTSRPSKSAMLRHLRHGGPHADKHWQQWHLESWSVEQLVALHDDDHNDAVPTFDEPAAVEAIVEHAPASADTIAAVLALHLLGPDETVAFGSLINVDVDAPESVLDVVRGLLVKQSWESESAGISATWGGGDRSLILGADRVSITPGVDVTARRSIVKVSATLTAISYDEGLTWITLDLSGAPDVTVKFR